MRFLSILKIEIEVKSMFFNDISTIKTTTIRAPEAIRKNELEHGFESLLNCGNMC